jgi:hypothetical protein
MKNLIKILLIVALAPIAISCEPEYPTPTPVSAHDPLTGKPRVLPKINVMAIHASPNAGTANLAVDNTPVAGTDLNFGQKFPAIPAIYSNAIDAGSRQIRVRAGNTSLLSTRQLLNGGTNHSFFVIGRGGVTATTRADRLRLIELLNETLPALPTGTPNTAHVRFFNFGLVTPTPADAPTTTTLPGISLRIDAASPVTAAPAGGFFLAPSATFPASAANTRNYAATTTAFTAFTVPAVGSAGNDYLIDVVRSNNGNVILNDVLVKLVAGRVYTLAMIGSDDPAEQAYQLLIITHR